MKVHYCVGCGSKHYRMNMASRLFRSKLVCGGCREIADEIEREEQEAREKMKRKMIKAKLKRMEDM